MNMTRMSFGWALAMAIAGAAAISAAAQQPAPAPDQAAKASPVITLSGCVQPESAVLKRNPVAADVGMGDEFVLTFATVTPPAGANEVPKPDVEPAPAAAGTSGSVGNFGKVYRLTGDKEKDLKSYAGQRVEITGALKDKEKAIDAMSSIGTSGKTELTPANTPEFTIDAIKPLSGSCPPAIK
jgi:hypothetical protein